MTRRLTIFLLASMLTWTFLLGSVASAQILPDGFDSTNIRSIWKFLDPRGGCSVVKDSVSPTSERLKFIVPAGLSRDPYPYSGFPPNRTARLVQKVGPLGNFAVLVKFDSVMNSMYQIKGIEAIEDDSSFIRCEVYCDSTDTAGHPGRTLRLNAYLASVVNGSVNQSVLPLSLRPDTTRTIWLRLDRINDNWTQRYSTNGISWTIANAIIQAIPIDSIGIHVAVTDPANTASGTNAPAFTAYIDSFGVGNPNDLPVQLSSFSAVLQSNRLVRLDWSTATETNNYGFDVQKSLGNTENFQTIPGSFVPGNGTTIEPHQYFYVDNSTSQGDWYYRLKQMDLDGSFNFTEPIQVSILSGVEDKSLPTAFALEQNYPNPFNPTTEIRYQISEVRGQRSEASRVALKVYDMLGREVATLVNEVKQPGTYSIQFDASQLTSGVYIYKLSSAGQSFTRKMTVMK